VAILLIDDERYMLRSLRRLLEREGYEVENASTGEEGLRLARTLKPWLVFLDVMLPGMHGLEVCQAIKRDPGLTGTQVVMLSARARPLDRDHARQAGADGYLAKPFSPTEVLLSARRAAACEEET
jgi:two-component system, OmpR family, alkaline phosphatase synthesis response regulator PhoP